MSKKFSRLLLLAIVLTVWSALVIPVSAGNNPQGTVTSQFDSIDDLADKKIAVLLGSTMDLYAVEHFPNATIERYQNPTDLLLAVKSGKVDAALYDELSLIVLRRTDSSVTQLGEPLYSGSTGAAFNQDNDALRIQFNTFLQGLRDQGIYDDMVDRWIKQGNNALPPVANDGSKGTLIVGCSSAMGLPMSTLIDGQRVGFDVELATRFAAYLGRKLKFQDLEFGSLVAAVNTNKIDMAISSMAITEERLKKVDFSDSYYESGAVVIILQKNLAGSQPDPSEPGSEPDQPKTFFQKIRDSFYNNIILENRYRLILSGLWVTVIIALLSALAGTLLGALVCFLRLSRNRVLRTVANLYISILRGLPALVLLLIIFYVVFASVPISALLVAVFAFSLHFAAYVSEMFRAAILSIDKGQTEAGIAGGFSRGQTFFYIVMPQAIRQVLPVYKGELISMVKMTSIVGYIAVEDLTKAGDIIRSRTFDAFFPLLLVALLYFLISGLLVVALSGLERRYRRPAARP